MASTFPCASRMTKSESPVFRDVVFKPRPELSVIPKHILVAFITDSLEGYALLNGLYDSTGLPVTRQ